MNLSSIFIRSSLLNLIASTCNKFFVFFISFYSAYILTKDEHGALSVFVFLVSVLSGVIAQSITIAANKILSVNSGSMNENSYSGCLNLILAAMAVWIIILALVLYDTELAIRLLTSNAVDKHEIFLLLAIIPLNIVTGVISGALQGQQLFRLLALANALPVIILIPLSVYLIRTGGVSGAVQALFCHSLVSTCLHVFFFYRGNSFPRFPALSVEGGQAVKSVFIPLLITSSLVTPAYWYATKSLSSTESGLAQASLFALVWQFGMILTHVIISLGGVIMPKMSQSDIAYEKNPINYSPTMLAAYFFIVPVALTVSFWGDYIFRGFSEKDFLTCMLLTLSALYISAFKSGIARVMALKSKGWISIISNAFWLLVFIYLIKSSDDLDASKLAADILLAHAINLLVFTPIFSKLGLISYSVIFSKSMIAITIGFLISITFAVYSEILWINLAILSALILPAILKLKDIRV